MFPDRLIAISTLIFASLLLSCQTKNRSTGPSSEDSQPAEGPLPTGYRLRRSYPTPNGKLWLLIDDRISEKQLTEHWGNDGGEGIGPNLRPAILLLNAPEGQKRTLMEVPLADLEITTIQGPSVSIYQLTEDRSIGMGSYAGPSTTWFQLTSQGVQHLQAVDAHNHSEPLRVSKTLKTEWKAVADKSGMSKEILMLACRPSATGGKFRVTYTRFFFDGKQWQRRDRSESGFWESDGGDFPDRKAFP